MVLSKQFSQEGYSVDAASDGEEALGYIAMSDYDCIVMDIMLPIQDGLTVLHRIRQKHNATPVLLLTAKKDGIKDKVIEISLRMAIGAK